MPVDTGKSSAVVLIGHGRRASDTPPDLIKEFRALTQSRTSEVEPSTRELALETQIRSWPRTPENDPYKSGLERIAGALRFEMPDTRIELAFNEFCAPSIDDAVITLEADGITSITLISTMFTPGGAHAERDIPETMERLQLLYPHVVIRYAWPVPLNIITKFLAQSILAVNE